MARQDLDDLKALEQFESDIQWVCDHFDELKRDYPDNYVAILRGKVIAHHSDLDRLLKELEPVHGERISDLAIKFIPSEPVELIL